MTSIKITLTPQWIKANARAAEHAALRPSFLASRHSADRLTAALGCDRATAERLRLCRLPRPERWGADVAALAAYAEVDAKIARQTP